MLATGLQIDGPSAVRYPRGTGEGLDISGPIQTLEIGRGETLFDSDEPEVAVLAVGYSVNMARVAVQKLREEGHEVALFNARFVKPLDEEAILDLARRSKRIVTVEENAKQGGFGSAVLELLARHEILVPVEVLGIGDAFVHHASPAQQRAEQGIDAAGIERAVRAALAPMDGIRAGH
jgi:1-deoxy-D-xylulose-5-phosphate synthase